MRNAACPLVFLIFVTLITTACSPQADTAWWYARQEWASWPAGGNPLFKAQSRTRNLAQNGCVLAGEKRVLSYSENLHTDYTQCVATPSPIVRDPAQRLQGR